MTLYAFCSPGGSPGVTTSALALTLAWPPPVLLAECDPAGGAILAGLFAGHLPAPRGLLGAAFDAGTGATVLSAGPGGQLAALDSNGGRMFLAGLTDPRQAPGLAPAWPAVARALAARHGDVLADCGRLDAADTQPIAVLAEADLAVLVLRPTLRQVAAAGPRIEMLAQVRGGTDRVGLLLVGDQGHRPAEIAKTLGVAVLATLPADSRTAAVLSDGVGRRGNLTDRPLMRSARTAVRAFGAAAAAPLAAGLPATGTAMPPGSGSRDAAAAAGGSPAAPAPAGTDRLSGSYRVPDADAVGAADEPMGFPGRGDIPGRGDMSGRGGIAGRGDMGGRGGIAGRGDMAGLGEMAGLGGLAGRGDFPRLDELIDRGDYPGLGGLMSQGELGGTNQYGSADGYSGANGNGGSNEYGRANEYGGANGNGSANEYCGADGNGSANEYGSANGDGGADGYGSANGHGSPNGKGSANGHRT